jgi:two-component system, chemotaxis family, chemotaxis protein CheY
MKYLVVDDAPTMRRIVINSLASVGENEVAEATDGVEALTKLREPNNNIGFIITDWIMPNMSGLELIKIIKKDPNLKNLPIILVTTRGEKNDIIEALKLGIDNYIVKPFSPSILKDKIDAVKEKLNIIY